MLHKISFRNIMQYAVSCFLVFFARIICEPACCPTRLTLKNQFSGYVRTVKFLHCYSFGQFLLLCSERASFSQKSVKCQVTDIHVKFYTFVQFLLLLFLGFIHRTRTLSPRGDNHHRLGYGMCHFLRVLFLAEK